MKIKLTQGKTALISYMDFIMLSSFHWTANKIGRKFYAKSSVKIHGKWSTVYMHSLIMGKREGLEIDHINHDGLDNRRSNLRFVTRSQNSLNNRLRITSTSKYKGVSFDKRYGKWMARFYFKGIKHYLGLHSTAEKAAKAYNDCAKIVAGEFANLNVIKGE
jgi:hypothetical protein